MRNEPRERVAGGSVQNRAGSGGRYWRQVSRAVCARVLGASRAGESMEGGNPVSIARTVQTSISPFGILVPTVGFSRASATASQTHRANGRCSSKWIPRDFGSESRRGSGKSIGSGNSFPHQEGRLHHALSQSIVKDTDRTPLGFLRPVDSPRGRRLEQREGRSFNAKRGPGAGPARWLRSRNSCRWPCR